jgi:hypothetical protein
VNAIRDSGISPPHEPGEERIALGSAGPEAGESGVLALDAQTGVAHHEHDGACLDLGEPVVGEGIYSVLIRHFHSSSASPTSSLVPP